MNIKYTRSEYRSWVISNRVLCPAPKCHVVNNTNRTYDVIVRVECLRVRL